MVEDRSLHFDFPSNLTRAIGCARGKRARNISRTISERFRRIIVKNDAGRPVLQTNREKGGPPPSIARISGVNRANFKRWLYFYYFSIVHDFLPSFLFFFSFDGTSEITRTVFPWKKKKKKNPSFVNDSRHARITDLIVRNWTSEGSIFLFFNITILNS